MRQIRSAVSKPTQLCSCHSTTSSFQGKDLLSLHASFDAVRAVQALRPGVHRAKDGSFRATFEDKPLLSDIVFLRAWIAVDLPRFYNPVTNLLAPPTAVARAPKPAKVRDAAVHGLSLSTGHFSGPQRAA